MFLQLVGIPAKHCYQLYHRLAAGVDNLVPYYACVAAVARAQCARHACACCLHSYVRVVCLHHRGVLARMHVEMLSVETLPPPRAPRAIFALG